MKNIERLFYVIIIIAIIVVGVLIYGKVSDTNTVDLLNTHIADLRQDNEQLIERLESARAGVAKLQDTLKEFERENNKLKNLLERSTEIAGGAEEENKAIAESIDKALEIVSRLKAEYQRE